LEVDLTNVKSGAMSRTGGSGTGGSGTGGSARPEEVQERRECTGAAIGLEMAGLDPELHLCLRRGQAGHG